MERPIGKPENYYIHDGYVCRLDNAHFDDTSFKDEWQRPVYEYAARMMEIHGLTTVTDVGCGSGYKLAHILGQFDTLGIDLDPSYSFVKQQYPDRKWAMADWNTTPPTADMVISADVIEHLVDPNLLLKYIADMQPRLVVLSTPERDSLGLGTEDGPPKNIHHVREWNLNQFAAYVGDYFRVLETHVAGGSTVVLCEPLSKSLAPTLWEMTRMEKLANEI